MSQYVDSRLALVATPPMMAVRAAQAPQTENSGSAGQIDSAATGLKLLAPICGMASTSIQIVTSHQWRETAEVRA